MTSEQLIALGGMTEEKKQYIISRYSSEEKTLSTAYICWFIFGVHYFYLNRPFINLLYWITGGGLGIWLILDLFRMSGLVQKYNNQRFLKIVEESQHI